MLDAVVDYLPSPIEVPPIEGFNPDNGEKITRPLLPDQPFAGLAFKTISDPNGDLTFIRVYTGVLKKGERYINGRTGRTERIGRLLRMHAAQREPLDQASAGDIVAAVGVKDMIDVEGLPTTYGSEIFKDNIAVKDDAMVAALRAAGGLMRDLCFGVCRQLPRLEQVRSRLRETLMGFRQDREEMTEEQQLAVDMLRQKIKQVDAAAEHVALEVRLAQLGDVQVAPEQAGAHRHLSRRSEQRFAINFCKVMKRILSTFM